MGAGQRPAASSAAQSVDQRLDDFFLASMPASSAALHDLGRGLLETALAGAAEVMRCLEQAKQHAARLLRSGPALALK
jgi:hypothetical protein